MVGWSRIDDSTYANRARSGGQSVVMVAAKDVAVLTVQSDGRTSRDEPDGVGASGSGRGGVE